MSDQIIDQDLEVNEAEVAEDELEKALNTALESLQKADPTDEESEDEDEPEDEEYEPKEKLSKKSKKSAMKSRRNQDEDYESLSKSLPENLEEDPEAAEVVDAMPFIKSLVDSLEEQFTSLVKAVVDLTDEVEDIKSSLAKSQKLEVASAKMIKSIRTELKDFGDTPNPVKSFIGQNLKVMKKSTTGKQDKEISPIQALEKLSSLHKSKRITLQQLVTAEAQIQKGIPLSEGLQQLIVSDSE